MSYFLNSSFLSPLPQNTNSVQIVPCFLSIQTQPQLIFPFSDHSQLSHLLLLNHSSKFCGQANSNMLHATQPQMFPDRQIDMKRLLHTPIFLSEKSTSGTNEYDIYQTVSNNSPHNTITSTTSSLVETCNLKLKTNIREDLWTEERIQLLIKWSKDYKQDWKKIAKRFQNKKITPFQAKTKYRSLTRENYTQQRVKFSAKEDLILAKYYRMYGTNWEKINEHFTKRDHIMLKNRFYAHIRKKNLLNSLLYLVDQLELKHNALIDDIEIDESMGFEVCRDSS